VIPAEVDERQRAGERSDAFLERIVRDKLAQVASLEAAKSMGALLVADTIVLLGDAILGKPQSPDDARATLGRLSGTSHEVLTRFALGRTAGELGVVAHAETVRSRVTFRDLTSDEIARYVATGEGADKAGGYAIQGIGSFAVSRIEGSYANVVGLPVCEVVLALKRLGLLGVFP